MHILKRASTFSANLRDGTLILNQFHSLPVLIGLPEDEKWPSFKVWGWVGELITGETSHVSRNLQTSFKFQTNSSWQHEGQENIFMHLKNTQFMQLPASAQLFCNPRRLQEDSDSAGLTLVTVPLHWQTISECQRPLHFMLHRSITSILRMTHHPSTGWIYDSTMEQSIHQSHLTFRRSHQE